jgi:CRP/FNR family transcriptional regulator, cyclic AMP receptor protein
MPELSVEEKRAALAKIDFFAGCSDRQLTDVAHLAGERDLDPGAELCHEGDFEQHAFVVLEGEAAASVSGSVVGTVGPGEVVGELAMLGDGHRTATLVARTPLRVLVLDADDIDSVLAADPHAQENLGPRPRQPGDGA